MAEKINKNLKEIIFSENSVQLPGKSAEQPAATLEWQLIRTALRGEPVHWLDGFLIFQTWREDEQKGDYRVLFRKVASHLQRVLENAGIEGGKMDHPGGKQHFWVLQFAGDTKLMSNISDSVQTTRQSRQVFCYPDPSNPDLGWVLIKKAYDEWPEPKSISEAIAFADHLPKDVAKYQDCFTKIKTLLEDYKDDILIKALTKVLSLAVEERQGIKRDIVLPIIAGWIEQYLCTNEALGILSGYPVIQPPSSSESISEFAYLADKCLDYMPYISAMNAYESRISYLHNQRDYSEREDHEAEASEAERYLGQLCRCEAVEKAVKDTTDYFEGLRHLKITDEMVKECLQAAVVSFLEQCNAPLKGITNVYSQFSRHLRVFIDRFYKSYGISKVLKSDETIDTKTSQISLWLKELPCDDKQSSRAEDLFNKYMRLYGKPNVLAELPCSSICPHDSSLGLQQIKDVLRIGSKDDSEWFRRTGPIAVDFRDNKVYTQIETRDKLKDLILDNPISMLVGESDTGKTVLVRDLAYELSQQKDLNIYHFSCNENRNFIHTNLAAKIKSMKGIFIFDDIHLSTRNVQLLYSALLPILTKNSGLHILFVGRLSFYNGQDPYLEKLDRLPYLPVKPFQDVDAIIQHYIKYCTVHKPHIRWPQKAVAEIKRASKKSYWLLAITLEGYCYESGQGDAKAWQKSGMDEIFARLSKSGDLHQNKYPQIVVALSPLYKNEIMTARDFLVGKLNLDSDAIEDLVRRGDVIKTKASNGEILYGLPHSGLASAYWEHGVVYLKAPELREYKDFIYDYAISDTSNGLEAIVTNSKNPRKILLKRLVKNKKLKQVIIKERSMTPLALLAGNIAAGYLETKCLLENNILNIIANKIVNPDDLWASGYCIQQLYKCDRQIGQKLWRLINIKTFANSLSKTENYISAWGCVYSIYKIYKKGARQLCSSMELPAIMQRITKDSRDIKFKLLFLSIVSKAHPDKWRAALSSFNLKLAIPDSPGIIGNIEGLFITLYYIFGVEPRVDVMMWVKLDHEWLARKLILSDNFATVVFCISLISGSINKTKALEFSRLLPRESLAKLVQKCPNKAMMKSNINSLSRINKDLAEWLERQYSK